MIKRNNKKSQLTARQKELLSKKIKKKVRAKNIKKKGFHADKATKGKYKKGIFWSKKNHKEFVFRSAYEFAYFHILEADHNVVSYIVEPFKIPYKWKNSKRNYIPDIMVLHKCGTINLIEIKPKAMIRDAMVQKKAAAARAFMKQHIKGGEYKFITEEDIFDTPQDYKKLLKIIQ